MGYYGCPRLASPDAETQPAKPGLIYVASSWRNPHYDEIVDLLRTVGLNLYDFRNPPDKAGFGWEQTMPADHQRFDQVLPAVYLKALQHPLALAGFDSDMNALRAADTVVLILPCGRSAHLELGWAVGAGKRTAILLEDPDRPMEPELMYRMVDYIAPSVADLLDWLGVED